MAKFIQRIKTELSAVKRDKSPVTLVDFTGWDKTDFGFQLVDLKIYNTEKGFFYPCEDFILRKVKNIKMLSNLVYGKLKYLKNG